MQHALVVGGTGMLRGVVEALAARGTVVSVIARSAGHLERLALDLARTGGQVEPLALDYRDGNALAAGLGRAQTAHGPIDVAVCWIHGIAPDAPEVVARSIAETPGRASPATYLHVLGSAAGDPAGVADERRVTSRPGLACRQAVLGFVIEGRRARWLTNAEISHGVLAALEGDADPFVVGTVRPWSARP